LFAVWRSNGSVSISRFDYENEKWSSLPQAQSSDERGDVAGAPSCLVRDDELWVSYGIEDSVSLGAVRVAYSDDAGETIVGRGTVSDPEAERHFLLPQIALESPDFGHAVYYGGAGHGDEAGSLRHVRFGIDDLPAPPLEPVEPPVEEEDPGLPSTALYEPVVFQLSTGDDRWHGESLGSTVVKGALYVAHVDNDSRQAHVRVVRIDL
jgi:hypothetical protein